VYHWHGRAYGAFLRAVPPARQTSPVGASVIA
jgi:hypothetical protein